MFTAQSMVKWLFPPTPTDSELKFYLSENRLRTLLIHSHQFHSLFL